MYLESPREKYSIQLAFPIHVFHIQGFIQLWIKNIKKKKKTPESSKNQTSNLPHAGNYLHIFYIVLGS